MRQRAGVTWALKLAKTHEQAGADEAKGANLESSSSQVPTRVRIRGRQQFLTVTGEGREYLPGVSTHSMLINALS